MDSKMITYRWLTQEDTELAAKIAEEFAKQGLPMPSPELSAIYVAVSDEGDLAGFHVLQFYPHAEPMMIKPEWRGKVNWREFQRGIESVFPKGASYLVIDPGDPRVANLCRRGGMEKISGGVWKQTIKPKAMEAGK